MAGEVHDMLCWRGPVSVDVFVIDSGNTPLPKEAFHLAGLVPDAYLPFPLLEQPEAVERLGLVSYDLDFDDVSLDLREYTPAGGFFIARRPLTVGTALQLGLGPKDLVLLLLTFAVGTITLGTGRTNVMQGAVHLVIFAAFVFLAFVP